MLATRLEHSLMMDSQLMYSTDGDDDGRDGRVDTNRGVEGLFREGLDDEENDNDDEDDADEDDDEDWGNRGISVGLVSVVDHAKVCEERDQLALEASNLRYTYSHIIS